VNFAWAGESHLVVEFGRIIDPKLNRHVHNLARKLEELALPGFVECIPSYRSLLISFDPLLLSGEKLMAVCEELVLQARSLDQDDPLVIEVPTLYGGEGGPDLQDVATLVGLSVDEVIAIHSSAAYQVYMIGFMPGYPYLGGLDERLAVPRLKVPRTKVRGGTVAIAEKQAGIYSVTSPGGWRLIGHTPLRLYTPEVDPPCLLKAGNFVRFRPVSQEEYLAISAAISEGDYRPVTYPLKQEGRQ
jgi:KipI family sensor histidine kinase inhibitor